MKKISIFWFRRDLRLEDNVGLFHALSGEFPVLPVFIFDSQILDELQPDDARVQFIHQTLQQIDSRLQELGSGVRCIKGKPIEVWKKLTQEYDIAAVHTNRDYEP